MRLLICAALFCTVLGVALAQAPAMPFNGAFETGIDGWTMQVKDSQTNDKPRQIPDALTWEKTDTAPDAKTGKPSAGALKLTFKDLPPNPVGHQTGAICMLGPVVKAAESDLLITFSAKLLASDNACLQINRTWGGGSTEPITLSKEWKQYAVCMQFGFDAAEVMFALIEPNTDNFYPRKVIAGTLLLDNVVITTVPKLKAEAGNVLKYGSFDAGPYLWNVRLYSEKPLGVRLAPEYLASETKDLPKAVANNPAAMKVTLKQLPAEALNHNTGACTYLAKIVKSAENDIKVTFYAKLLTPADANLQIARMSGGSTATPVKLTHEWAAYEMTVPIAYDTPALVFSLVAPTDTNTGLHCVIEGTFLIDQVVVTAVPKAQK